jgi:hypothetical protein
MKSFILFFDKIINRPSHKFFLNFFFLKNNFYFNFKNILFIQFFTNLKNTFNIKLLKFNYYFYKNFILYFFLLNSIIQIYIIFVLL